MLERRIRYKALENRLQQMWARKGDLNNVDLGQEYYLVTFSSEEDHGFTLMDWAWLIYSHYLSVREWGVNFCPSGDAIEQLVL